MFSIISVLLVDLIVTVTNVRNFIVPLDGVSACIITSSYTRKIIYIYSLTFAFFRAVRLIN